MLELLKVFGIFSEKYNLQGTQVATCWLFLIHRCTPKFVFSAERV